MDVMAEPVRRTIPVSYLSSSNLHADDFLPCGGDFGTLDVACVPALADDDDTDKNNRKLKSNPKVKP